MIENLVGESIDIYTADANYPEEWDLKGLEDNLHVVFLQRKALNSIIFKS